MTGTHEEAQTNEEVGSPPPLSPPVEEGDSSRSTEAESSEGATGDAPHPSSPIPYPSLFTHRPSAALIEALDRLLVPDA